MTVPVVVVLSFFGVTFVLSAFSALPLVGSGDGFPTEVLDDVDESNPEIPSPLVWAAPARKG